MLTVKELEPRIYELTLSGVVEKSDIETMKRDLTPVLEGEGKTGIVVRAEDFKDVTGDALVEDARFEFGMLPKWSKVKKVAVVTDKQAFEAILRWMDPVLPMIEFRTFSPSEAARAEEWVAELPEATAPKGPGVKLVEDGSDGLLIFEIDGKMTQEGTDQIFEAFDRAVEKNGKVNLMVRVKDYEGFDLAMLGDRDLMTSKFGAVGKVGRYAVVGAPGWMRSMVRIMGPLLPMEIRDFDASDDAAARTWAKSG